MGHVTWRACKESGLRWARLEYVSCTRTCCHRSSTISRNAFRSSIMLAWCENKNSILRTNLSKSLNPFQSLPIHHLSHYRYHLLLFQKTVQVSDSPFFQHCCPAGKFSTGAQNHCLLSRRAEKRPPVTLHFFWVWWVLNYAADEMLWTRTVLGNTQCIRAL